MSYRVRVCSLPSFFQSFSPCSHNRNAYIISSLFKMLDKVYSYQNQELQTFLWNDFIFFIINILNFGLYISLKLFVVILLEIFKWINMNNIVIFSIEFSIFQSISFSKLAFSFNLVFTYLIILWNAFYYALVSSRTRALSTKWVTNTQQRLRQPSAKCAIEGSCVLSTSFPIQLESIKRRERTSLIIVNYNDIEHPRLKFYYLMQVDN